MFNRNIARLHEAIATLIIISRCIKMNDNPNWRHPLEFSFSYNRKEKLEEQFNRELDEVNELKTACSEEEIKKCITYAKRYADAHYPLKYTFKIREFGIWDKDVHDCLTNIAKHSDKNKFIVLFLVFYEVLSLVFLEHRQREIYAIQQKEKQLTGEMIDNITRQSFMKICERVLPAWSKDDPALQQVIKAEFEKLASSSSQHLEFYQLLVDNKADNHPKMAAHMKLLQAFQWRIKGERMAEEEDIEALIKTRQSEPSNTMTGP